VYYNDANAAIEFYVMGKRGLGVTVNDGKTPSYGGGTLHGLWYSDYMLLHSDRRLKKNIRPLVESLDTNAKKAGVSPTEDSARWVLRELRPVSFEFKRGPETKAPRFGFIADDLQATIPQVVREKEDGERLKGILFEDLVAVLAAALQSMQRQLEEFSTSMTAQSHRHSLEYETRKRLDDMEARLVRVEQSVALQYDSLREGLKGIEAMIESRLPRPGTLSRLHESLQDGGVRGFDAVASEAALSWTAKGGLHYEDEVRV